MAKGFLTIMAMWVIATFCNFACADSGEIVPAARPMQMQVSSNAHVKYPIIYEGDHLTLDKAVGEVRFFLPTFSPGRPEVNPESPRKVIIEGSTSLFFDKPGEYYLNLDGKEQIKVLVLDSSQPISSSVTRLFDFLSANLIASSGNDSEYYQGPPDFAQDFFRSSAPKMLLCGPTLSFINDLVKDRFRLPARDVTFTGTYVEAGQVKYVTHNVIEIYLPDLKKWVLFDTNFGFLAKWKDAFELAEDSRRVSSTGEDISEQEYESLQLNIHANVVPLAAKNANESSGVFDTDMLTQKKKQEYWRFLFRAFLSGPGYWGGEDLGAADCRLGITFIPADSMSLPCYWRPSCVGRPIGI